MKEVLYTDFYAFRCSVIYNNQLSLFQNEADNTPQGKNEVFRKILEKLKKSKKLFSAYDKRNYLLLYLRNYNDVIHCQLGRETSKKQSILELDKGKFVKEDAKEYPYINIFINIKSQKIFTQCNTNVFKNSITAGKVMSNIITNFINETNDNVKIDLIPITESSRFWYFFDNHIPVYNITFNLDTPNIFDLPDLGYKLIKSASQDINSTDMQLTFNNEEGKLNPNKNSFNSIIELIASGGGRWAVKYLNSHGKKRTATSTNKEKKCSIEISNDDLNSDIIANEKVLNIIDAFDSVEHYDHLKS